MNSNSTRLGKSITGWCPWDKIIGKGLKFCLSPLVLPYCQERQSDLMLSRPYCPQSWAYLYYTISPPTFLSLSLSLSLSFPIPSNPAIPKCILWIIYAKPLPLPQNIPRHLPIITKQDKTTQYLAHGLHWSTSTIPPSTRQDLLAIRLGLVAVKGVLFICCVITYLPILPDLTWPDLTWPDLTWPDLTWPALRIVSFTYDTVKQHTYLPTCLR